MTIDTKELPLILETVRVHNKAYKKRVNEYLQAISSRKGKPTVALRTRIVTASDLFEKLERALTFIEDGLEDYE